MALLGRALPAPIRFTAGFGKLVSVSWGEEISDCGGSTRLTAFFLIVCRILTCSLCIIGKVKLCRILILIGIDRYLIPLSRSSHDAKLELELDLGVFCSLSLSTNKDLPNRSNPLNRTNEPGGDAPDRAITSLHTRHDARRLQHQSINTSSGRSRLWGTVSVLISKNTRDQCRTYRYRRHGEKE